MIRALALLAALVAAGCAAEPTPALTPSPTPAGTPVPTATPTLAPTATPSPTLDPRDAEYATQEVSVSGARFTALVADTQARQSLGLGQRDGLPEEMAMLFVYPAEAERSFWMRGMRFPIDIVWIDGDLRVVGVSSDVPPPEAGTADADLPLYSPGVPVRWVLEINAGLADALGIVEGTLVTMGAP